MLQVIEIEFSYLYNVLRGISTELHHNLSLE